MAKGKQALKSANRRAESAHQIIDRLTSELADAKVRAREAEARSARLEGADALVERSLVKNDEMLSSALEALAQWKSINKQWHERREALRIEVGNRLLPDIEIAGARLGECRTDRAEFLARRYPALWYVMVGEAPTDRHVYARSPFVRSESKMSTDQLRRFQRLSGQRAIAEGDDLDGRDAADVWADLLDLGQMDDLTRDEKIEMLDL